MKFKPFLLLMVFVATLSVNAQQKTTRIPLKNFEGKQVTLSTLAKPNSVTVVMLWATWCKPCINELDAVSELLPDWQDELDFNIYAISVDDSRSFSKVKSFVNGRAWDFEILFDPNQDFKRAVGANNIPFTAILKNGEVVYKHAGYLPGDEEDLWQKIVHYND